MWERALRRAALPVAYTEGFSPRPKLSFGLALSTGHESLGEYLDVDAGGTGRRRRASLPGSIRACPSASTSGGGRGRARHAVAAGGRHQPARGGSRSIGLGRRRARASELVGDVLCAPTRSSSPETQGQGGHRRPPPRRPVARRGRRRRDRADRRAGHPTSRPAPVRARRRPAPIGDGSRPRDGCAGLHQWMSTDGAREEPLPLPTATFDAHADARR